MAASNVLAGASPEATALYRSLLSELRPLGAFEEEVKKTSIHLSRKSAFVGVHFRRSHLIITIKAAARIASPRVFKADQVSKSRWHCEVKLASAAEIDQEFVTWVRDAYDLCG